MLSQALFSAVLDVFDESFSVALEVIPFHFQVDNHSL
jgi:hypothetical protein